MSGKNVSISKKRCVHFDDSTFTHKTMPPELLQAKLKTNLKIRLQRYESLLYYITYIILCTRPLFRRGHYVYLQSLINNVLQIWLWMKHLQLFVRRGRRKYILVVYTKCFGAPQMCSQSPIFAHPWLQDLNMWCSVEYLDVRTDLIGPP